MSGTSQKSQTDVVRLLTLALLEEARKLETAITGKSAETVDLKGLLESTERIREIHGNLKAAFAPSEGRSKIIERLLLQWNNMLFGIFYVAGELTAKGFVTRRQFEILTAAVDEIVKTMGKAPAAKSAPTAGEKQPG